MAHRYALIIEYEGTAYAGWQRQSGAPTVQEFLEVALSKIAASSIRVQAAGRTDTGVHALGQVVHFDSEVERHPKAWLRGANTHLPPDIRIHWAASVPDDFHARFSAESRRYRYLFYVAPVKSALYRNLAVWRRDDLDSRAMTAGAQYLLGEQDFSAFRSSDCGSPTAVRRVLCAEVRRVGRFVIFEIEANAFLHHMVRNIVGSLLKVGVRQCQPEWIKTLLQGRDRTVAGVTAPAAGLYLVAVKYPSSYAIPIREDARGIG